MKILEYSKTFFANGNARTIAMKRNVLYMLLIKGCSIFLGMFTVPLTLGYVNNETYGLLVHNFPNGISNAVRCSWSKFLWVRWVSIDSSRACPQRGV